MNEPGRNLLDLIISLLPGLTSVEAISLQQGFDREEDFIVQYREDAGKLLKRGLKAYLDIDEICAKAQRVETVCQMRSIEWVSYVNADYPPLLREMYDPPAVIYYRGRLPNPEKSLLGMVGTRRPSPEASAQAYSIAGGAGQAGVSVVSGLALGIDAMSHRGNISGGAPTYAVLGSGVDEVYPSTNRELAKRILDSGGALISEYPPGARPNKWNFPARNRIISALSRGVLIVEAPQKSGALITAGFALEQGKDLWVASCGAKEQHSDSLYDRSGTIKLAGDGAELIHSANDILEKWNMAAPFKDDADAVPVWDAYGRELAASMANFLEIEL
jgi:DNA processing protein